MGPPEIVREQQLGCLQIRHLFTLHFMQMNDANVLIFVL